MADVSALDDGPGEEAAGGGRLEALGDFGLFAGATARRLPGVGRYTSEALNQARIMSSGTFGLVAFLSS